MKRITPPVFTITLALILFGSLAYAAKKKEQGKTLARTADTVSEEALKAELLNSPEERQKALPYADRKGSGKIIPASAQENVNDRIMAGQPQLSE